jgi:hypothetical protein
VALARRPLARAATRDRGLASRIPSPARPYAARGPSLLLGDPEDPLALLVGLWERASLQLDRLCRGNGIAYYHFLQPNQYVAGSKPFSDWEREHAIRVDNRYADGVVAGYPLLREAGLRLREGGVRFVDLSGIFRDAAETIYFDDCCHMNERGHARLAAAIAERMLSDD